MASNPQTTPFTKYLTPESLDRFFADYRIISRSPALEDKLPAFFEMLGPLLVKSQHVVRSKLGEKIDSVILDRFFTDLREPLIAARQAGQLCNPWEIASLRRDEVRNAKVLAWLLDCRGSHGLGDALLAAVLPDFFPSGLLNDYRVRLESCPDGDRGNRVDIEIDGENFYLIIEVKIDAPEGKEQLNRYCRIAKSKHRGRQWKVVYLTPRGRLSSTELEFPDHILYLSWHTVSASISRFIGNSYNNDSNLSMESNFTKLLAYAFSRHIAQF